MSPDEAQKALRHRIANAIRCVCNLHAMRATLCHEERLVVAEAVLVAIAAHRASVEAGPSRGADAPLAPEGIDNEPSDADYDRFWNTVQGCARTAAGIDAALCSFWRREPGYEFTEGDRTRMAGAVVAYLRAASVGEGQPSAAGAASAPEGQTKCPDCGDAPTGECVLCGGDGRLASSTVAVLVERMRRAEAEVAGKPIAAHVAVCGPVSQDEAKAIGSMIAAATKMMADQSGGCAPSPPEGLDARLLDALTKSHQALADLGSRIQCTAGGFWQVRHPHSEMQAVIAAVDEAMLLYHVVTRASGDVAVATSDSPVVPIEGAKPEERQV